MEETTQIRKFGKNKTTRKNSVLEKTVEETYTSNARKRAV